MEQPKSEILTIDEIEKLYKTLRIDFSLLPEYSSFENYCKHLTNQENQSSSMQLMSNTEVL